MPINFDTFNKWIKIDFNPYTIFSAPSGSTIVIVNSTISTDTPSSGFIQLGTSFADQDGMADLSSGHNWQADPEEFIIFDHAGGPDTITLNQNCTTFGQVLSHLNTRLAAGAYNHSTYLEFIEDPDYPNHVYLRYKLGYEGLGYGFRLWAGSGTLDAITTLGMSAEAEFGDADTYYYSSFSGSTFILTSSLTKTYNQNWACIASYSEIDMQIIYNQTMDWVDEQTSMDDTVPLQAVGKKDLGGGIYTDIIYELINGWKIKLWDGQYPLSIKGTVITSDASNPFHFPNYWGAVQVQFKTGTSGIIASPIIDSAEQTAIANRVWTVTDGAKVRKITTNRWKIEGNQLKIYDDNGTTVIAIFNLSGSQTTPYSERTPT